MALGYGITIVTRLCKTYYLIGFGPECRVWLLTELGMAIGPQTTKMPPLAGLRVGRAYLVVAQCRMP